MTNLLSTKGRLSAFKKHLYENNQEDYRNFVNFIRKLEAQIDFLTTQSNHQYQEFCHTLSEKIYIEEKKAKLITDNWEKEQFIGK